MKYWIQCRIVAFLTAVVTLTGVILGEIPTNSISTILTLLSVFIYYISYNLKKREI